MLLFLNRCWLFLCVIFLIGSFGCTRTQTTPLLIESIQRLPLKTVQVDGNQITYVDSGSGPPVILIHGFGGAIWNWEHQQLNLSSQYRVITLDLLGSGQSDKPDIRYSPSRLVTFFLQFMDTLEIRQATLIGNSMGAGLAIATAITAPERVKALVLISGFPQTLKGSIQSPLYKRFLEHRPPLWLAKVGNWIVGRWATERVLKEILYDHSVLTPLVIERSFQNRNRENTIFPLYSLMDHMDEWAPKFGTRMGEIHHPTLILWGEEDRIFPLDVGQHVRELLPHASWHPIAQGGHFLQWEKPQQVNHFILDFLSDVVDK